jgi:hypothetical protein
MTQDEKTPRRLLQEECGLQLSYFLDKHPLTETSCFDITGAILDAIKEAGGVVLMKTRRADVQGNHHFYPIATAGQRKQTFINGGSLEGDWLEEDALVYINVLEDQ